MKFLLPLSLTHSLTHTHTHTHTHTLTLSLSLSLCCISCLFKLIICFTFIYCRLQARGTQIENGECNVSNVVGNANNTYSGANYPTTNDTFNGVNYQNTNSTFSGGNYQNNVGNYQTGGANYQKSSYPPLYQQNLVTIVLSKIILSSSI